MTENETAAQKKKREAQEAARLKAQEEKTAADKEAQETQAKKEAEKEAAKANLPNNDHLSDEEREEQGLKAIEEAANNDEDPDDYVMSTVHDDVIREKLAQGSTSKARQAAAENYRLQQERQAQLERDTQRGLGFNGVRPEGESDKDVLV